MKTAKVKTLSVGRLYNIGNYEHIRFEVTVEIPPGVKTRDVLTDTVATLQLLKPLKKPFNYDAHKAAVLKVAEELTESEKLHIEEWRDEVTQYEAAKAMRFEAINKFDALGGVSKHTDAKAMWNNDDTPF